MDTCFRHYRIKSRTRFIIFVTLSLILAVVLVNTLIGSYNASSETIKTYMDIQVQSGDTLWSIAETYMPADMDLRHAVYKLCLINDIENNYIYAGQIIQVPVYQQTFNILSTISFRTLIFNFAIFITHDFLKK